MADSPESSGVISITIVLPDHASGRLDKALADAAPEGAGLSRSRLTQLVRDGAVHLAGAAVTDPKAKVTGGEVCEVHLPSATEVRAQPEAIPLDIRFEDEHLIVVNKPAGMVVHPAPGAETGTLVNALLHHCGDSLSGIGGEKRPGIVHRIDKDTSGLLVVAKTDAAHQGLSALFAAHDIDRHYRALVWGWPHQGDPRLAGLEGVLFEPGGVLRIEGNIDRHRHDRKRMAVVKSGGRRAVTRARVIETFGPDDKPACSLLDCWLETGRTHQIRVHLSHIGHALIGDPVYGRSRKLAKNALPESAERSLRAFGRQALHAAVLGFRHPISGDNMHFEAELPTDFAELLVSLAEQAK